MDMVLNSPSVQAPASFHLINLPSPLSFRGAPTSADWKALDTGIKTFLVQLHQLLSRYNRHFGYRVANEMACFINFAIAQSADPEKVRQEALDLAILQKVLPKFHGTQQELSAVLNALFSFAVSGSYKQ